MADIVLVRVCRVGVRGRVFVARGACVIVWRGRVFVARVTGSVFVARGRGVGRDDGAC